MKFTEVTRYNYPKKSRSHVLRGNGVCDALRHGTQSMGTRGYIFLRLTLIKA